MGKDITSSEEAVYKRAEDITDEDIIDLEETVTKRDAALEEEKRFDVDYQLSADGVSKNRRGGIDQDE
ncbi:hypothetical protein BOTCAL_0582g00070 [Botryotinia calthae]|uniref:Uncharacterized protein n=1 Tax=Botryotinia calthae TaxID=38488 RepID=A0A4Y8CLK5_9HELO|nr:hypothetical protein BOTCAL_0582g00070 [Botryotinia calthae]